MRLTVYIETTDEGVRCCAEMDGVDAHTSSEANIAAIGAIEVAKASLLARRWGVNIGNFTPPAIVTKEGGPPSHSPQAKRVKPRRHR